MLDNIKNNTVIIVPKQIKKKIIKSLNDMNILNVKVITFDEVKREILFSYDEKSIYYLCKKYNLKVPVANMFIENMYYINPNKKYNNPKLDMLVDYYNDLSSEGLISDNLYFKEFLKVRNVVILGFDYLTKLELYLLERIKEWTRVEISLNNSFKPRKLEIMEYPTIKEEVQGAAIKICELINNGIDINKIKIVNLSSDYHNLVNRIFKYYNIPINLSTSDSIIGTNIANDFLTLLKDNTRETVISKLLIKYKKASQNELDIINKLINIVNKYNWYEDDLNDLIELVKYDLHSIKSKSDLMKNAVNITELENCDETDYVFIFGINQGSIPRVIKNERYITNDLCENTYLDTTFELMKKEKESLINNLYRLKNLYLSYKLFDTSKEVYPSSIIKEYDMKVIHNKINYNISYSDRYNQIILASMYDELVKYNTLSNDISLFNANYDIDYLSYDNNYTKIDSSKLNAYLDNKLNLSYSHLDNYYKCSFKYYMHHILKLGHYEETFITLIGNLYHYMFSKCYNENFNFNKEYNYYMKDKVLTPKESLLLERLKNELKFIIDALSKQQFNTGLDDMYFEKNIHFKIPSKLDVTFKGFVDKIMYKKNSNNTLVSIIDYKTGKTDISLNNIKYGLGMQLPMYLYLIKKSEMFNNPKIVGFYLQNVLSYDEKASKTKSLEQRKLEGLKLNGYSTDDESALAIFDASYEDSIYIKSMKKTKNGFGPYAKIVTDNKVEEIVKIVDDKINEAVSDIEDAKFNINPKIVDGKNKSCTFCEYRDICFMTNDNLVYLDGGDIDG